MASRQTWKIWLRLLRRPASYTTQYFGCELGATSKFDEKTGAFVNGRHEKAKLEGLLENFVKKYVQCYGCLNPETEIIITKTQMLQLKCAACGHVSDVDMRDKLTNFILKEMRRAEKEQLKERKVADKALKRLKKKDAVNTSKDGVKAGVANKKKAVSDEDNNSPNGSEGDKDEVSDDDNEWKTDTSIEAAHRRSQEQLSAATAKMVLLSPTEPEKVPKSSVEAAAITKNGTENGNAKGSIHKKLVEEIQGNLKKWSDATQMQSFLASLNGSSEEVMNALFEVLIQGVAKGFSKEVSKKINYLTAATQNDEAQMLLLRAIDNFCRKSKPDAVKDVAMVLKILYDAGVLEEEYIVEWYEEGLKSATKKSQIWKNTKPFIEWLQNAESESE